MQTSRGAILIFLLQQVTMCALDDSERCGVLNPFTEYFVLLSKFKDIQSD